MVGYDAVGLAIRLVATRGAQMNMAKYRKELHRKAFAMINMKRNGK